MASAAIRSRPFRFRPEKYQALFEQVGLAAKQERDPYYRYTMASVASEAQQRIAEREASQRRSPFAALENMFGDDDDDDDEFEDFDSEEEQCDCPSCRAKRARAEAASGKQRASGKQPARGNQSTQSLFAEFDEDEDDDTDEDWDDGDVLGLSPAAILAAIGPSSAFMLKVTDRFRQRGAEGQLESLSDDVALDMNDPSRIGDLKIKAITLFKAQGSRPQ